LDELCISKKRNLWLWTLRPPSVAVAVSRYTGQLLAFVLGDRTWDNVARLWSKIPQAWQRRLVYTDGYGAYAAFFSPWQHRPCEKFDGGTCTVEGVNHSLRHRCGALVRRTSARCRDQSLLEKRIHLSAEAHNQAGERRVKRRERKAKTTGPKR